MGRREYAAHAGLAAGRHGRAESLASAWAQRDAAKARSERRAKWAVRLIMVALTVIVIITY